MNDDCKDIPAPDSMAENDDQVGDYPNNRLKRSRRNRAPIDRMSDQYDEIYKTYYSSKKRKTLEHLSNSNNNINNRKRTEISVCDDGSSIAKFRWIGDSVKTLINDNNYVIGDRKHYQQIEMKKMNFRQILSVGDCIALCPPPSSQDSSLNNKQSNNETNTKKSKRLKLNFDSEQRVEGASNSTLLIGRIQDMWEDLEHLHIECQSKLFKQEYDTKNDLDGNGRMKIHVQLFLKKQDIEQYKPHQFTNMKQSQLLSSLTDNDLLLASSRTPDITSDDTNIFTATDRVYSVSSIINKCTVLRFKPLSYNHVLDNSGNSNNEMISVLVDDSIKDLNDEVTNSSQNTVSNHKSTYFCRYDITFKQTSTRSGGRESILVTPWGGEDEYEINSKSHNKSSQSSQDLLEPFVDDNADIIDSDETGRSISSSPTPRKITLPKAPISEGKANAGKIEIGDDHQAKIPSLGISLSIESNCKYTSRRESGSPTLMWKPPESNITTSMPFNPTNYLQQVDDFKINSYLNEAAKILSKYTFDNNFDLSNSKKSKRKNPYQEEVTWIATSLSPKSNTSSSVPSFAFIHREFNIEKLLSILLKSGYNTSQALNEISQSPKDYMSIDWTINTINLFQIGFQRYTNNLKMISKMMHEDIKKVTDYYYKFHIPDQFRRFQEKKYEQARAIMNECTEMITQDDVENDNETDSKVDDYNQHSPPPQDLLVNIRKLLGPTDFMKFARALKNYGDDKISMTNMRNECLSLLNDHKDLVKNFLTFLP